jgi:hypothetical protein
MITKNILRGAEEIAQFLGWSKRKFYYGLEELKEAGVVWIELRGRPPKKSLTSMISLLERWVVMRNQDNYKINNPV